MKNYPWSNEGLDYDVAVIGAGMSGLMLVRRLMADPRTAGIRVLLLEKELSEYAPRTWCFWEERHGGSDGTVSLSSPEDLNEPGICKEWDQAELFLGNERLDMDLQPFRYTMIDAAEWRKTVLANVLANPNVSLAKAEVAGLEEDASSARFSAAGRSYRCGWVFDSRWDGDVLRSYGGHVLYQQFVGWKVVCNKPVFDPGKARLMDFRVDQPGAVAFCYLLPLNARQALVEYTLFTPDMRDWQVLGESVRDYLSVNFPGVLFQVDSVEQGMIPMTDYPFGSGQKRVVAIGTAGGCSKASTGYTFAFARQHASAIVSALASGSRPPAFGDLYSRRFGFYDRVMLRVILEAPDSGASILYRLFQRNAAPRVLRFLSNRSSVWDELKIFAGLPVGVFFRAAFRECISAGRWKRSVVRSSAGSRPHRNAERETEAA